MAEAVCRISRRSHVFVLTDDGSYSGTLTELAQMNLPPGVYTGQVSETPNGVQWAVIGFDVTDQGLSIRYVDFAL